MLSSEGVQLGLGVGVGVGVAVGTGVGVAVGTGVGVAVGAGVGVGTGVGVAGVGVAVGAAVGVGVAPGPRVGVGVGVAVGAGDGVPQFFTVTETVPVCWRLSAIVIVAVPAATPVTMNHETRWPFTAGSDQSRAVSAATVATRVFDDDDEAMA